MMQINTISSKIKCYNTRILDKLRVFIKPNPSKTTKQEVKVQLNYQLRQLSVQLKIKPFTFN